MGARGRERDHETEQRVREIHAQLIDFGFSATNPQIAAVLSIERGTKITPAMVRSRTRRWTQKIAPPTDHNPLVPPDGWEDLRPWVELRRAREIAQGQIAGAANTTSTIICELERGRRRITPRWIERYRDAVERCVAALDERRREADP